jgi:hypothetical protein
MLSTKPPGKTMKMTSIALLATALALTAGTANALGSADRAEQLRQSAEMNLPMLGAANSPGGRAGTAMPMNAADARAAEFRTNTDMMRPQTFGSPAMVKGEVPAARTPDDRAAAEMMRRTDMMKPN